MSAERDAELPGRLLRSERDVFLPLLRAAPEADFSLPTASCPDWNVRQVLAHCGAALTRIIEGRLERGVYSDASNAADVAERDDWPLARVLDELERGMTEAGPLIAGHTHGRLDTVALGEWVHAGDVRDAWGLPGAYADTSAGGDVPALLVIASTVRKDTPRVEVALTDASPATLSLGNVHEDRAPATLTADTPTLIRLYTGRPLAASSYVLEGASPDELCIYG
ncbi:maleylpyruvate isomerase family mycothiol-dependent enzyme [Streptomyces iconiensis]|uniref:Maleylpyruvate isomerase family mycothiol-dependent enzyme n=1 Tax=Streptomyces iconiensis TaxID=1384038 RepID=A0ABT7A805_9ACTN|nr:maleylpyruvate isomerase family mycothiol-dependent enzyme [Streptomyces iconiensis]MDJ1137436.1 maleylpyruvate isomerase family mycothiol-dependent enzyme [Streptomyces iconiensis]